MTEVTYLGSVHGAQAALRRMLPRDRGTIVQVGSALAHRGIPLQATYCGAKHALQGFFESLRCELRHRGSNVHLTMVQMPGMNTTQFGWVRLHVPNEPQPVAPIYQPEVAARAIHWAAHHRRRELWVGISTVVHDRRQPPGAVAGRVVPGQDRASRASRPTSRPRPTAATTCSRPVDDDQDHGAHGDFGARAHAAQPAGLGLAPPARARGGRGRRAAAAGAARRSRRVRR